MANHGLTPALTQNRSLDHGSDLDQRNDVPGRVTLPGRQQLGFDGWPALREGLRGLYLDRPTGTERAPSTAQDAAARALHQYAANLQALNTAKSVEAIRDIAEAIREMGTSPDRVRWEGVSNTPGTKWT
ncbi:hypothetical protein [Streptomyces sp. NPDC054842]